MNIGIDIRSLMSPIRTGVGEYAFELLNTLFSLDKTNQYFLFYNSYADISANIPRWSQDNVHYIATRWPNKLFNGAMKIVNYPKLDKLISKKITTTPYSLLLTPLDAFFSPNLNFTSLSRKTKFILTIHDLSFEFFPEFLTPKQRLWHKIVNPKRQCERTDVILTPSENTKRDIVDYYGIAAEKIKVIYPGVKLDYGPASPAGGLRTTDCGLRTEIKQKYNLPDKFILFLGTIEPRKNIVGLITAFEKAYSLLLTPYSLVIAGAAGWKNKNIYARAAASPLKDKIKFIGYVAPEDKPTIYAAAELFVYPSFYEGFGFPVLEAMAMGLPVITSNRSSLPEITAGAAYLINPRDPNDIAAGMAHLLNHPESSQNPRNPSHHPRNLYIKNDLIQAAKFSWESAATEFLKLYI